VEATKLDITYGADGSIYSPSVDGELISATLLALNVSMLHEVTTTAAAGQPTRPSARHALALSPESTTYLIRSFERMDRDVGELFKIILTELERIANLLGYELDGCGEAMLRLVSSLGCIVLVLHTMDEGHYTVVHLPIAHDQAAEGGLHRCTVSDNFFNMETLLYPGFADASKPAVLDALRFLAAAVYAARASEGESGGLSQVTMDGWGALTTDLAAKLTIDTVLDRASRTMQAGNSCGLNAIAYALAHVDPVVTQNTARWEPSSNPFCAHAIELRSVIGALPKHEGGRTTPDTDAAGLLAASRLALTGLAVAEHALNPTTLDFIKSSIIGAAASATSANVSAPLPVESALASAATSAASAAATALAPIAESALVASAGSAAASAIAPSAGAENVGAASADSADTSAPLPADSALVSPATSAASAAASALAPAAESALVASAGSASASAIAPSAGAESAGAASVASADASAPLPAESAIACAVTSAASAGASALAPAAESAPIASAGQAVASATAPSAGAESAGASADASGSGDPARREESALSRAVSLVAAAATAIVTSPLKGVAALSSALFPLRRLSAPGSGGGARRAGLRAPLSGAPTRQASLGATLPLATPARLRSGHLRPAAPAEAAEGSPPARLMLPAQGSTTMGSQVGAASDLSLARVLRARPPASTPETAVGASASSARKRSAAGPPATASASSSGSNRTPSAIATSRPRRK